VAGDVVTVEVDMAKYKHVDLDAENALRLLAELRKRRESNDIDEAIRYIRNFDEFYEYMRKKFKDYIAPPHRPEDYIRGRAVVDKVKLYIDGQGRKRVVIVFDRRVKTDEIVEALKTIGFQVEVKKAF